MSTASAKNFIASHIEANGPISVAEYMDLALYHPEYGYYITSDPVGAASDFITAPEVSQLFGELVGLWCIDSWNALSKPSKFNLVELGPGRGTLMTDLLRAAKVRSKFIEAANIYPIETNRYLRQKQMDAFGKSNKITWHDDFSNLPDHPTIIVANEFFDCLPVRQFVVTDQGWRERGVGVNDDRTLNFVALESSERDLEVQGKFENIITNGTIAEVSPARTNFMREIAHILTTRTGRGLFVDYGHEKSGIGDTLQAVHNHQYANVLDRPGEIDLTAHVDFEVLAEAATTEETIVDGPIMQAAFLGQMGIEARTQKLLALAAPHQAATIRAGFDRLMSPDQMGSLFKVLTVSTKGLNPPAGF